MSLLSRGWRAAAVASSMLLATAQVATRDQAFRLDVNTVAVYATVTDARGALVTDLVAADFEIDDDGRRQPLTVFKSGSQPITTAILVDQSPSVFPTAALSRTMVTEFARRLLPGDRACLGTFSQVVSLDPAFTGDQETLLRHLGDNVPWPAGTALWDAVEAGRAALDLEGGRRVILLVTDAQDNCSRSDVEQVRTRLQQEGVMVYAVGVRGREGLDTSDIGAVARATGGWCFELKAAADVGATAQRIADELHLQYVLGFSPQKLDDRVHRLDIKVRKPGLTVRARRSFVASSHAGGR
jgi:Ca-activated chloride channel homolog